MPEPMIESIRKHMDAGYVLGDIEFAQEAEALDAATNGTFVRPSELTQDVVSAELLRRTAGHVPADSIEAELARRGV